MKVSVIIPCYNERETIEAIVHAVRSSAIADLECAHNYNNYLIGLVRQGSERTSLFVESS